MTEEHGMTSKKEVIIIRWQIIPEPKNKRTSSTSLKTSKQTKIQTRKLLSISEDMPYKFQWDIVE